MALEVELDKKKLEFTDDKGQKVKVDQNQNQQFLKKLIKI